MNQPTRPLDQPAALLLRPWTFGEKPPASTLVTASCGHLGWLSPPGKRFCDSNPQVTLICLHCMPAQYIPTHLVPGTTHFLLSELDLDVGDQAMALAALRALQALGITEPPSE